MFIPLFSNKTLKRCAAILITLVLVCPSGYAGAQGVQLSTPGTRLALSDAFIPPLLKGIKVYRNDPFRFDFILDKGDAKLSDAQVKSDSTRLIKYFLASLTVPEKDLWVNLSPYEKDRIVPEAFGQTEMGRDLLAQDYILKQITASVIYPDEKVGKEFWDKVYAEALKRYGTTDVPIDTFNKVWIMPETATVYENKDAAFVVESKLKVMLEEDYLALEKNTDVKIQITQTIPAGTNKIGSEIIREVVIPILEKEVNAGMNFAPLRQVYNSLILATWYKRKVKDSIMGQAYVDKQKTSGIDIEDKNEKEKIWLRYVEAFKKGAFNFVKEEKNAVTQEVVPRKYFSGGTILLMTPFKVVDSATSLDGVISDGMIIQVKGDIQMPQQPVENNRVWKTTDIREHNKDFFYTVKMYGLDRILRPTGKNLPVSYSLSLISADYLHTYELDFSTIGLIFEFRDEDVIAVLARMTNIATFNKTNETQGNFIGKQLKHDPKNVLYQSIINGRIKKKLNVTPQQLIVASKKSDRQEWDLNNEIIVKNNQHLIPKAIVLIVRKYTNTSFSEMLRNLMNRPEYASVYNAMRLGQFPVVIVGEEGSLLENAREIFKETFPDFHEKRPFLFEKQVDDSENGTGGIDLNPSQINMNINHGDDGVGFNFDPAMLIRLKNASGISPIIIGVQQLRSLSKFLDAS